MLEMAALGGVSPRAALGLLAHMHAKSEPLELLEISLTRHNFDHARADVPHHIRIRNPLPTPETANMDGERYNPSLIRLWRVWRTTKEMMNDRVGCAVSNARLRADSIQGLHGG